ncbi:30S ribosomal protein S3 [Mesomycoplasma moatsii]|uniref:30S ribosomal protein S3 n=1 Tax=Mesomycoplasma moatsii TaxID=171287 RepID=UPI0003B61117
MGQKVNPNGFRYGITKPHNTVWYADKNNFPRLLLEDQKIYQYLDQFTREYGIGKVEIKRLQNGKVTVFIHTAKPGVVLGQEGNNIKTLTKNIQKFTKNKSLNLNIEVVVIENPSLNAKLLAEDIAIKLENRGSFRNAQKQVIRDAMKAGASGIKTKVSGRLNGVDMARSEGYSEGEMKLHTLRQNVDYATATARTTYGAIGVKVWLSLGDVKEGGK